MDVASHSKALAGGEQARAGCKSTVLFSLQSKGVQVMTIRNWLASWMMGGLFIFVLSTGVAFANVAVVSVKGDVNHLPDTFADTFTLDLPAPGPYTVNLRHNGGPDVFETLALQIFAGSGTSGTALAGISGPGTFSFNANSAGLYTAFLFGDKSKAHGGGTFEISVAAVPELETWVMLLAGMALIGYLLRRKGQLTGGPTPTNLASAA
jgi:hypothetical protein